MDERDVRNAHRRDDSRSRGRDRDRNRRRRSRSPSPRRSPDRKDKKDAEGKNDEKVKKEAFAAFSKALGVTL